MLGLSRLFISPAWAQTMEYVPMDNGDLLTARYAKFVPLAMFVLVVYLVFFYKKRKK